MKNRQGNTSDFTLSPPGLSPGVDPLSLADEEGELGEPEFLEDLDIRIDAEGVWFWDGSPIRRKDMVCMLAYMLERDVDGTYWLRTPTEYGRVTVEDAPFVGVAVFVAGEGDEQVVSVLTNVDQIITVDATHPLRMSTDPATGGPRPYVGVGGGLDARLTRAAYYELVEHGHEEEVGGEHLFGIRSAGHFFALGSLAEEEEAAG